MKKQYEIPEMDILRLDVKDTLTAEQEGEWYQTSEGVEEW